MITRWDMYIAHLWWGANCGPVALATILDISLGDVRRIAPEFAERRSMTYETIKAAIRRTGCSYQEIGAQYPVHGLASVDRAGDPHGHVIAVSGSKMLDTFSLDYRGGWRGLEGWKRANKRYRVCWGLEVER